MTTIPQTKKLNNKYVWTCDYCGKEFNTLKKCDEHELKCDKNQNRFDFPYIKNPKKSWLILWVTTMLVFGITLYINLGLFPKGINLFNEKGVLYLFLANIILGIIAFFGTMLSLNRNEKNVSSIVKYSLVFCFIYLLFNAGIVLSLDTILKEQKVKKDYLKYQTATIMPQNLTPTQTSDMVNCSISKECGGGTKLLKKSVCDNSTCCGFTGGKWVFYQSISACKRDQNKELGVQSNTTKINCIGPDGKTFQTTQVECDNFNKAWGKKPVNTQAPVYNNQNINKYPACVVYYPGLKTTDTYYHLSPSECINLKNKVASGSVPPTSSNITCVVNYSCTGNSYTYTVDKSTCEFMQSSAASTCRTAGVIQEIYNISHSTYPAIVVPTIDGTIHMEVTPTVGVPYGFSN